jgi:hypothetical protein
MRDPKFGWHWLWILPLALCVMGKDAIVYKGRALRHRRRMKKILRHNPDIARLSRLSGIPQGKNNKHGQDRV